jgi:hypothetical protein
MIISIIIVAFILMMIYIYPHAHFHFHFHTYKNTNRMTCSSLKCPPLWRPCEAVTFLRGVVGKWRPIRSTGLYSQMAVCTTLHQDRCVCVCDRRAGESLLSCIYVYTHSFFFTYDMISVNTKKGGGLSLHYSVMRLPFIIKHNFLRTHPHTHIKHII